MASKEIESQVEAELSTFVDSMAALNLTLTEDEIETKRKELTAAYSGEDTALVQAEAGAAETWEQVQAMLSQGDVLILDDYQKLDDKSVLINVPFWINKWWFTPGDLGDFAVLQCIASRPVRTPAGETQKIVLTDGSTGIFRQLRDLTMRTGQSTKMLVRNGLRVSQYTAETDAGSKMAETYYLT
jgi:hypothetical protein